MTTADRLTGLGRMIGLILSLFIAGALLTGLTFFSMSWAGQHVLRAMREDVFRQLHRLSLSYYAEHEAGDLMSRITNDATAIEQALNFALVNVLSAASCCWCGWPTTCSTAACRWRCSRWPSRPSC